MENLKTYYRGDHIAVLVITNGGVNLQDYDIEALFYTTGNGYRVNASTTPCGTCLPAAVRRENEISIAIPSGESSQMDPGVCKIEVKYTHRATGITKILKNRVFELKDSKAAKQFCSHE